MSTEHNPYLRYPANPRLNLNLEFLSSAGDPRTTTLRDVVGNDETSLDDLAEAARSCKTLYGRVHNRASVAAKVSSGLRGTPIDPRACACARLLIESPDAVWFDLDGLRPIRTKRELAEALFTEDELDGPLADLGAPPIDSGVGWYRASVVYRVQHNAAVLVRAWSDRDAQDKLEALWSEDDGFWQEIEETPENLDESGFFVEAVEKAGAKDRALVADASLRAGSYFWLIP